MPKKAEFQESRYVPPAIAKQKVSPPGQKSMSDASLNLTPDHSADGSAFKPLSANSIWGPAALSVVCDDDSHDKQAWNNSDSTSSSSRSSSRQELSSIMDSEGAPSNGMWNSAYTEELTPTPQQSGVGLHSSLPDQGSCTGSQWASARGAYSAPSSPSLPRTNNQPLSGPPSVVAQPSVDDIAVSSWTSKQRSPRSQSSSEPLSTGWTENVPAQRRSSVDMSQSFPGDAGIPSHPWQEVQHSQGYPPGLVTRENWKETGGVRSASVDVTQLLQRLALEKYLPVFEVMREPAIFPQVLVPDLFSLCKLNVCCTLGRDQQDTICIKYQLFQLFTCQSIPPKKSRKQTMFQAIMQTLQFLR